MYSSKDRQTLFDWYEIKLKWKQTKNNYKSINYLRTNTKKKIKRNEMKYKKIQKGIIIIIIIDTSHQLINLMQTLRFIIFVILSVLC